MRSAGILAALAVTAISIGAAAGEPAPDDTRIVSDPLYLPLAGQIYGDSGYLYDSSTRDVFDSTGAYAGTVNSNLNEFTQNVLYGLTDDLALHFDWGYGTRTASSHPAGGGFSQRDSSGWTDPDFGLVYRLMDQRDTPLTLDLRADYSPDAFPGKAANSNDVGTIARGGQMVDLGASFGHIGPMFTVAATFDAMWNGRRDILNQNSGELTRTDSLWNYRMGLASQARLTDAISVNAGVGHTFVGNADVFSQTTGLEHLTSGGDFTDIDAALNYEFMPNTLVGSLEYQHNFYQASRNIFPLSPNDNTTIRNKDEDLFGVRLRYVLP